VITTEVLPDDAALRLERRSRVLDAMEAASIDILVLGREANARYVSGVPRLWLAGTRPFGAGCVVVRSSGGVHLLTSWDEGVPDDIPHDNLFGYTFNHTNTLAALRAIDGAAQIGVVATDAMSAGAAGLLSSAFPSARVVDGEALMRSVRRIKLDAEVSLIRRAVDIAERSTAAAIASLSPGTTDRQLTGVFMEAMGGEGVCMPSIQDVAWTTSRTRAWHRSGRDSVVAEGDLVVFEAGVMVDGYAGELARTVCVGTPSDQAAALLRRCDDLWQRLFDACRPGAPSSALLTVYDEAGEPPPPMPVAHGLGLGFDSPLVSAHLPTTAATHRLEPGMVLAVTASVWQGGIGAAVGQEPIVITDDGAALLSSVPFAP
jgi:Xaa-Pro dipeptidase